MTSIITPAYNPVRCKFEKLIQSIKRQSNKEYEWIIIDDGSQMDIASEYRKDLDGLNYRIMRNSRNSGVGETRNNGIRNSSGSHIVFVDCDDYISDDFVERIESAIQDYNPDFLFFDYYREKKGKIKKCSTLDKISPGIVDKNEAIIASSTNVCGKAVRKSIISDYDISFPSLKRYEDWAFMTEALFSANTIYYINNSIYYYVDNLDSAVHNSGGLSYEYAFDAFNIIKESTTFDKDIQELLYIREVIYTVIKENGKKKQKNELDGIVSRYESLFPEWKNNKYMNRLNISKKVVLNLYLLKQYYLLKLILKFA